MPPKGKIKITYLLKLKYMLVEVVMQCFISVVNAELFKAVLHKVLKSKNIKNSNAVSLVISEVLFSKKSVIHL